MAHDSKIQQTIPLQIVSQGDLHRVKRELRSLDDYIKQAQLRQPGTPLERLPKTSRSLNDLATLNKLNLLSEEDREKTGTFLDQLIDHGPVVNVSFATDPSSAFMVKLTAWFRENIDPLIMVNVGLEPTIAAGCIVRTDNKLHDFSLRRHFSAQRPLLLSKIRGATKPA